MEHRPKAVGAPRRRGLLLRVLDRATRPPALTIYAVLNLSLSLMVAVRHHRAVEGPLGPAGDIATGDFMAFYTGATFVREGRGRELYDLKTQQDFQLELTGPPNTQWQPYINPPLLAVTLSPVSALPYRYSYWTFAALTLLAFVAAMLLLRPHLPNLRRDRLVWFTTLALTASWLPLFRSVAGGQNSVITILFLAAVYAAWRSDRPVLAGVALGLVSYKPQFGLLIALAFLSRGMISALAAAGLTAGAHYALGALFMGADWPVRLFETLRVHRTLERTIFDSHFSILPALRFSLPGTPALILAAVAIIGVVLLCLWQSRRIDLKDARFPVLYGLLVTGGMLVSPHLQHYDIAVLAIPVLLTVDYLVGAGQKPGLALRLALMVGYLFYPVYRTAESIHFQPLFLWLAAVFLWNWKILASPRPERAAGEVGSATAELRGSEAYPAAPA